MNKKNASKRPGHEHIPGLDDYELKPHYDLDYRKAKPNRFAGKVKFTHGGARKNAGRKPAPEELVAKRVYLYPRHVKFLEKIDKNVSAAIRKLVDATEKR
jgi:hypothetical protein